VLAQVKTLVHAPGVTGYSGPYPVAGAVLRSRGRTAGVQAEGRGQAPAPVDQPKLTAGSWVRDGGVVLERTFADALGVGVGDRVTLNGRPFRVAGIAVTAASPPYPNLCYIGCTEAGGPGARFTTRQIGLAWITEPDAHALAPGQAFVPYVLNLKLKDPAMAEAFASAHGGNNNPASNAPGLTPWQRIAAADGLLVQDEQQVLSVGAWLAGLLAVASVAVLAGGRMAERTQRVGLLKAVGGTPGLVAAVLLAENLILALAAALAGLAAGRLAAPLVANPGAGLVGTPGAPSITLPDAGLVVAVALAVGLAATLVPAIRAARTSTVSALANAAGPPAAAGGRPDRDLGAAAGAAAARAAAGGPQAAPRGADRGQHRGHGHRDRRRARLPRHRRREALRGGERAGRSGGQPG
jgi:putative ABC transport system permease protein